VEFLKGTFASGDTVQKVGATSNNVVLNSAPDSAIASLVLFDDDGDITDTVTIIGATTNTTNYRKITVNSADRHNGTHTGGGVVINPTADNHVFQIGEDNFHLEWVRVTDWQGSSKEGVRINNDCTIEQCIFHDSSNGAADGIFIDTDNITVDIINVIIFDIKRGGIVIQSSSKTGVVLNISNCAIKECLDTIDAGIHGQYGINSGTMNCINCAAFDPVTEGQNDFGKAAGASFGSSEKNISGDGTAPGTGSLIDKTASDNFVNATPGSEDFHGKDTADMKGAGKDLSGTFNIDIDGDTRTLPWSMGVDDIPTTGGGGLILLGANNLTGGKLALNGGKL